MTEETIDSGNSGQCTLSVRLGTDRLTFAIAPQEGGSTRTDIFGCPLDETLPLTANLKQVFGQKKWLGKPFGQINVVVDNARNTFMPLEFFEDGLAEEVFYFNLRKKENETVMYNILHHNNIVVIFGMDSSAHALLKEQWPEARFYAQATPCIEYFIAHSRTVRSRTLYAVMGKSHMGCYAFEHGHMLLANHLPCQNTADRLYFLLYAWKRLEFDQEQDRLMLAGEQYDREQLMTELRKYIRQTGVMSPETNLDLHILSGLA